jgi:hypothetical protein
MMPMVQGMTKMYRYALAIDIDRLKSLTSLCAYGLFACFWTLTLREALYVISCFYCGFGSQPNTGSRHYHCVVYRSYKGVDNVTLL